MSTKTFEHHNGRIAYDETGSGPLVICALSIASWRRSWLRPVSGS